MLAALKTKKVEAAKPVKAPAKKAVVPKKKIIRKKAVKKAVAPAVIPVVPAQEEKK